MWKFSRNALFGLMGISVAILAAAPAQADGYRKHRHGGSVVKIVKTKKVVYVNPNRRWRHAKVRRVDYRERRRWKRRPVRVIHHYRPARVVYHDNHYSNRVLGGGVIGAAIGALTGSQIGQKRLPGQVEDPPAR